MISLSATDLQLVVRRIPIDVRKLMQRERLFLAGGFIRESIAGNKVHDLDIFGVSQQALKVSAQELYTKRLGVEASTRWHETKYAFSVFCQPRSPVQFIHAWCYDDVEKLIEELDFTVCQAAVWYNRTGGEWESMASEGFYPDLAARRLVYTFPNRIEAAGGSLMRVRKFMARGYNIQAHSLAGVVARLVCGIDEGRLGGLLGCGYSIEQARHIVLKSLLHEVDPLLVVDAVEPRDEGEEL